MIWVHPHNSTRKDPLKEVLKGTPMNPLNPLRYHYRSLKGALKGIPIDPLKEPRKESLWRPLHVPRTVWE